MDVDPNPELKVQAFETITISDDEKEISGDKPGVRSRFSWDKKSADCMLGTWLGSCMGSLRERVPALYYYLHPVTTGFCHSTACVLYHIFCFAWAIFLPVFVGTCIATFVPLMVLACTGIPLLYLLAEVMIIVARIELNVGFYLVEDSEEFLVERPDDVQVILYRGMPNWRTLYRGPYLARIKHIFGTIRFYLLCLYDLLLKPLLTAFTCWVGLLPLISFGALLMPFIYAGVGDFCLFGKKNGCAWNINGADDVLAVFAFGLFTLPLSAIISNLVAKGVNRASYYFLTGIYLTSGPRENPDVASLLAISSRQDVEKV